MSGRCRACNKTLTDSELNSNHPITGEPEDFCGVCRRISDGIMIPPTPEPYTVLTETGVAVEDFSMSTETI